MGGERSLKPRQSLRFQETTAVERNVGPGLPSLSRGGTSGGLGQESRCELGAKEALRAQQYLLASANKVVLSGTPGAASVSNSSLMGFPSPAWTCRPLTRHGQASPSLQLLCPTWPGALVAPRVPSRSSMCTE